MASCGSGKREIHLPYSGPLSDALQDNDGAVISVMPTVNLRINVSLIVTKGKDKIRCRIGTTVKGVNDLLLAFFYHHPKKENECRTNFDCGLAHYWIGYYHSLCAWWFMEG